MRVEAAKRDQERCSMCIGCRFFCGNFDGLDKNLENIDEKIPERTGGKLYKAA